MHRQIKLFKKLQQKGFFHLLVSNYSVQFLVFGSHLLIAKIMAPEDVGIIKTIETFINMAIVLGSGGVIFAILKVIPEFKESNKKHFSLIFSLKYAAVFSLTVFLAFNLIAYLGFVSQDGDLLYWFHRYSFLIIPSVLVLLLMRYYQAVDKFKRISTLIFYLKLLSACFVLAFTYYFFIGGYVWSMVVTTLIIMIVLLLDLRKTIFTFPSSSLFEKSKISRKIKDLSTTAFFAQIIDQFKLHSGFIIANYIIADRIQFGHYAFALILIQGLNIISTSVQQFIIPRMSETSNDRPSFFKKIGLYERKFVYISTIVFILAQVLLPFIVDLIFKEKYEDSIILLRIMLIGWYVQAFYALKGVVFLSLGKMKFISYASSLILLISGPIIVLLNYKFGVIGSASSFLFQNIVSLIVISHFVRRISKSY